MRIVYQGANEIVRRARDAFPDADHVPVDAAGPVPEDAHGDLLVTLGWRGPVLEELLARPISWVHTLAAGVDDFPLELVGDRTLTASKGALARPIAEWAVAQLLAVAKRVCEERLSEPPERWNEPALGLGTLDGAVLAVLGAGGIGARVAELGVALGAEVRTMRRSASPSPVDGVRVVGDVTALVDAADAVVLAAPLTADTRGIIDARALAGVSPGAHLVNVARGALIVEDALRDALDTGQLAYASLDAFDPEPIPAGHWVWGHPGVAITPHMSWSSPRTWDLLFDAFADNVRRHADGRPLSGVVDVDAGY